MEFCPLFSHPETHCCSLGGQDRTLMSHCSAEGFGFWWFLPPDAAVLSAQRVHEKISDAAVLSAQKVHENPQPHLNLADNVISNFTTTPRRYTQIWCATRQVKNRLKTSGKKPQETLNDCSKQMGSVQWCPGWWHEGGTPKLPLPRATNCIYPSPGIKPGSAPSWAGSKCFNFPIKSQPK